MNYGECEECGVKLEAVWFKEIEYNWEYNCPTGRIRDAVDYLFCPVCGSKSCVDNTFDGSWHRER